MSTRISETHTPIYSTEPSPSGRGQGEGARSALDGPGKFSPRSPHPGPLPEGEGEERRGVGTTLRSSTHLVAARGRVDRKSTRLNSSHTCISYAVFFLQKT